jgi:hypothetical protein
VIEGERRDVANVPLDLRDFLQRGCIPYLGEVVRATVVDVEGFDLVAEPR